MGNLFYALLILLGIVTLYRIGLYLYLHTELCSSTSKVEQQDAQVYRTERTGITPGVISWSVDLIDDEMPNQTYKKKIWGKYER